MTAPALEAARLREIAARLGRDPAEAHTCRRIIALARALEGNARPAVELGTNDLIIGGDVIRLQPKVAEMAAVLLKFGEARHGQIAVSLWGAEGGPYNAVTLTHLYAVKLRRIIRPYGWDVENIWGWGYRLVRKVEA